MSHDPSLIALRPATADDARAVWEWRNDDAARAASFSSDPIPWESHAPWFLARLADPGSRIAIALDPAGEPIGFVRFDLAAGDPATAVISVGLAPASRGHGYGRRVIAAACTELFAGRGAAAFAAATPRTVLAYVKPENGASLRAFRAAGFTETGTAAVRGGEAVLLERQATPAALLLARPDVGATSGLGHLRRCLTVAAALRPQGVETAFLLPAGAGAGLARAGGFAVEAATAPRGTADDAVELVATARRLGVASVLIDSYLLGADALAAVAAAGLRVAVFDDLCAGPFACDLVINGGLGAELLPYVAAPGAAPRFLVGAAFAPLRPGIASGDVDRPAPAPGRGQRLHLLLAFGGADPTGTLPLALAALDDLSGPALDVTAVVGPLATNGAAVQAAAQASHHLVEVIVDPPDLPALIATADLAVSAGGGTLVELAAAGIPAVAVEVAPNQRRGIGALAAAGAVLAAGAVGDDPASLRAAIAAAVTTLVADGSLRREMAKRGSREIDGHGAGRIAVALAQLTHR